MRLSIVTESFRPQLTGVAETIVRIVDSLRRLGVEVEVIAPEPGPGERVPEFPYKVHWITSKTLRPIAPVRLGMPVPAIGEAIAAFAPDVVYLASPYMMCARAATAAKELGIPVIANFQTLPEAIAGPGKQAFAATIWKQIESIHRLADLNLAPTQTAADAISARGIEGVRVWQHGIDTVQFRPELRSERLRDALAGDRKLLVGYVGRVTPQKQIDLLAATAELDDVAFVVVGTGSDEARIAELIPNATMLGPRRGTALARIFASLDVFVHPSGLETFGITVREAQASGRAVVVPDEGGSADLVAHGVDGLHAETENPAAFAEAVAALRDDTTLRERLGVAARRTCLDYDWDALTADLVDMAEALVAARGGRP
ncbi:glycosyltransferase [Glycomyces sp. NPDC046736]|uniref:glycosyltransferase n=1 Tax=Glycomyces sp. NPDC046736 TaxID=3155615 RepID=UPI0033D0D156